VSNRRAPLELYRNTTADVGNWVTVSLRQNGGNVDAIGAVISVQTEDSVQSIQQVIGGGHGGGQLLPRHFGLGAADHADVKVEWPDGTTSDMQVHAGERIVIQKP